MTFAMTRRDFDPHSGPLISFCLPYVMIFRVHLFYKNKVSMDWIQTKKCVKCFMESIQQKQKITKCHSTDNMESGTNFDDSIVQL